MRGMRFMPKWTPEQEEAIYKDNSNIIVSAGAGSGKTAVLSERVIRKLKEGVRIDELLILTFTNAAALEMKERIRKKILEEGLKEQEELLDRAYIMTFDAYALSLVKKYYYLLNIDKDITIGEESLFTILKEEYLDEIFNDLYGEDNALFNKLINDFCSKDDNTIKEAILSIDNSINLIYDKKRFIKNYVANYYTEENIREKITAYQELIYKYLSDLEDMVSDFAKYVSNDYYDKRY